MLPSDASAQRAQTAPQTKIAESSPAPQFQFNRIEAALTALCFIFMVAGIAAENLGAPTWLHTGLFLVSYLTGGYVGTRTALEALREKRLDVNVLMIVAAIGAASIGYWAEGAMLLFLFSLSNTLQAFAMERSRNAIRALMKLRPNEALRRAADGTEKIVPIEALQIGDMILVKPGERIAMDGRIEHGASAIDQSAITGESMPVERAPGDDVFAGSVNGQGALEIRVTRLAQDTTLARVIELVEQAQGRKAQTQRFLDEFEPKYAFGVIAFSLLTLVVSYFVMNMSWDASFYRAMTLLVVASPCALVISTPASILSAIANAARNSILFKGGSYLEQAASIQSIALDKTGTLTLGKPRVTDVVVAAEALGEKWFDAAFFEQLNPSGPSTPERCTADELVLWAASVEKRSEHPLGDAIVAEAQQRNLTLAQVDDLVALSGLGVTGTVDGALIQIGNKRMMEAANQVWPEPLRRRARDLESEGKTVIGISRNNHPIGFIAVADTLRPQARQALDTLRARGIHRIIMLTGDTRRVAESIARQVGIDEFYADLLPQDKVTLVERFAKQNATAMVGDGVNDAPALAVSHLGVAMGAIGSDVALETADVVLMRDDLMRLPYLIDLARRARRIVWQNIAFSLTVIVVLILSVFAITLPLPLGVVGHEGSTLLVVLNGLRLLRTH
ncbi:MAG: Zinc-transporting ATPase [Anaerolineae bacterium]|nr:Zinc-transporting ATPase [Anaerolineae bacterium]